MTVKIIATALLWGMSFGVMFFGTLVSLWHLRRKTLNPGAEKKVFPISILKPLKGLDPGIRENLESFFNLDYPSFELLFSVADADDSVIPVVRELIQRHAGVPARLIVGDVKIGFNPKINNLIQSYEQAKHDWMLISDANTRVPSDYLRRLATYLGDDVGVASGVVGGFEADGIGGHVEAAFLNTFLARGTIAAFYVGRPIVIGKSMIFRRSMAETFGGMRMLARYLAEDYMMGEMMGKLGLKVILMRAPVRQYVGQCSLKTFWSRHVRWGRLRKAHAPLAFALEPFGGVVISGILGAYAFVMLLHLPALFFLLGHVGIWGGCDLLMMKRLVGKITPSSVFGWFLREALAFPLWFCTSLGSTVMWQGHRLKLRYGGTLESST